MADLRISELPELQKGNLAQGDVLPITDVSASETKKVKVNSLITDGVNSLPPGSIESNKLSYLPESIPGTAIVKNTIEGGPDGQIALNTITGINIVDESIGNQQISDLDGAKLDDGTVTNDKLAGGIDGSKLVDGSVDSIKLSSVDGGLLVDGTVTDDKIAGPIDGGKLADDSVPSIKLNDIPGDKIIAGTMPADRLDESTLNRSIDLDDDGNLGIANEITAATMSGITYNEQGLITDAVPLEPNDLPIATETTVGAISVPPSSGLTVSAVGEIDHATVIAPGTTSGITVDEHGHVNSMVPLVGSDLPIATNDEIGAIKVPSDGKFTVGADGALTHNDTPAGTGPFAKVEVDSSGHVVAGSGLEASDIPGLDADQIISGQFDTDNIADDSITSAKLADYSTCLMQEDNPGQGDFLGQFWYTPSTAQLRVYSRGSGPENIWLPVGFGALQANNLRWGGTYDADADTIVSLTAIGVSEGLTAGQSFPPASDKLSGIYFICQIAGSNCVQPDLNNINHTSGDWALCIDGTQGWIHIDVNGGGGGGGGGAQYLNDLGDVTIGGSSGPFSTQPALALSGNQILKYDGGMGQWRNTDIIDGGSY